MNKNLAVLLLALAAGCAGTGGGSDSGFVTNPEVQGMYVPPMDPKRKVSEQDCSKAVDIGTGAGNLMCKGRDLEAERRAKIEEERQAKARLAAADRGARERAERERLERERAEQAAREEAARKARAAEEERLAAERRQAEEAARNSREARERQQKAEAEALARQRAEQEAREAAERERRRLEQAWLEGRALLERFVTNYGKVEEFKEVADPITGFLDKTRDVKR